MSNLEYLIYLILIVLVSIFFIVLFFYNKRHKKPKHIKEKDYNYLKENKRIKFKRNDKFNWDVYDDETKIDELQFLGLDIWEDQNRAMKRLKDLKKEFEENKYIFLNVVEMFFLLEDSSEQISISESGNYYAHALGIKNLIEKEYDVETKNKVKEIRKNLQETNEEIEIDAKKLFFIMKNAKNFGLDRISNNSMFFQFLTRKNEKIIIDAAEDIKKNKEQESKIKVTLESFKNGDEVESKRILGISSKEERDRTNTFREISENFRKENKVTHLENGITEINYPNGLKLLKRGLWEIIDVKTKEDIEKEKDEESFKKQSRAIESIEVDKNKILSTEIKETKEVKIKKDNDYLKKPLGNINLLSENGPSSYYKYFKNIEDQNSFIKEITNLSSENINKIMEILFSSKVFIVDKVPMFLKNSSEEYFLNYEYMIYIFFNMVDNQNKLINELKNKNSTFALSYPVLFVTAYLNSFKSMNNFNLLENEKWRATVIQINDFAYRMNLVQVSKEFIDYIFITGKENILKGVFEISFLSKEDEINFKNNQKYLHITLDFFRSGDNHNE